MPDPIQSPPPAAVPPSIDLEPVVITATARPAASEASTAEPTLGELAIQCLPKLGGVALVVAGAATADPLVIVLGAGKSGYELAECIEETRFNAKAQASLQRALDECRDDGGVPMGVVAGELSCALPEDAP